MLHSATPDSGSRARGFRRLHSLPFSFMVEGSRFTKRMKGLLDDLFSKT
jgi:hypothetical protein